MRIRQRFGIINYERMENIRPCKPFKTEQIHKKLFKWAMEERREKWKYCFKMVNSMVALFQILM